MKTVTLTDEAAARLEAWKLSPDEPLSDVVLRKVEDPAPDAESPKNGAAPGPRPADFLGCAAGMMTFNPGWDEPEPPEIWHALNDDLPL